jgi:hypothetical protein
LVIHFGRIHAALFYPSFWRAYFHGWREEPGLIEDGSDQLAVSQNNVDIPDPEILTQSPPPPRERQSENPLAHAGVALLAVGSGEMPDQRENTLPRADHPV